MLKKIKFILDFVFKAFTSHRSRWISSIIVLLCGIIIVNVSVISWFISQKEIDKNFTNNEDLKILNISFDAQSAKMTYNSINTYAETNMYYKPLGNITNIDEPIDLITNNGDNFSVKYIVLNYEMLEYIKMDQYFSQEQWNTEKSIIFNENSIGGIEKSNITESKDFIVEDFEVVKMQVGDAFMQSNLFNDDTSNPIILKKYNIDEYNLFLPKKWDAYSIISEETWLNILSQKSGKSVNYLKQNIKYEHGMLVIVKDFKDIDTVANDFKLQQFRVEYGLSDFENLTKTVEYFKIGAIFFTILIIIMIMITNINLIKQFIHEQRHEIGLMKSLGYSSRIILLIHLGEFMLQAVIIVIIVSIINLLGINLIIGLKFNILIYFIVLCLDVILLLILPMIIIFFIIHKEVNKADYILLKGE